MWTVGVNDQHTMAPIHPAEPSLLREGLCTDHENAHWWTMSAPRGNSSEYAQGSAAAKSICGKCPVKGVCREVTDYIERADPRGGLDPSFFAGIRAGEGTKNRADRRRRENEHPAARRLLRAS